MPLTCDSSLFTHEIIKEYLEKGGRFNSPQSAAKGCTDKIRCYG